MVSAEESELAALHWLVEVLGTELVGQISGHEGPDVADWLAGRAAIAPDAIPRIATAGAATAWLLPDEFPALARQWWFSPQVALGGQEPWLLVNIDPDSVIEAARDFFG